MNLDKQSISEELGGFRSLDSRKLIANAVFNDEIEVERNYFSTAQEDYFLEKFRWAPGETSHEISILYEEGEEAFISRKSNGPDGPESELFYRSDESVYSDSVQSVQDFDNLVESLQDEAEKVERVEKLEEYPIEDGVRNI